MAEATKDKPKVEKPETPTALVSKFKSHGQEYTTLRISREVGDKLKAGVRYDVKVAADGTLTLKPSAAKPKARSAARR